MTRLRRGTGDKGLMVSSLAQYWNMRPEEIAATYPCETFAVEPFSRYLRGMTVHADPDTVFRWVCQLKVAPYSYDWLDNFGRRSPRELTPGTDDLDVGQLFQVARIVEFERGRHITSTATPQAAWIFGLIAMTYQVSPAEAGTTRLVCCLTVGALSGPRRFSRWLLGWGDLVMMRKQLRTLKERAESSVAV